MAESLLTLQVVPGSNLLLNVILHLRLGDQCPYAFQAFELAKVVNNLYGMKIFQTFLVIL